MSVASALALFPSLAPLCSAEEPDRERELERIRSQIESLKGDISRIDEEQAGLEAELERTEVQVRLQQQQVAEVQTERELAEEALARSEERAAELEAALAHARDGLIERLGSVYRHDERDILRSFLTPERSNEAFVEIRMLRLLAHRDAYWVDRYRTASRELERELQILAAHRRELEETVGRERQRLRQLARTRTLQRRALEVMRTRREGVAERASRLAVKEEKLSLLLDILANQQFALPAGVVIQSFEGALDWPISGEIVQGFGLESEDRYQTKIPHNGIEIATRPGEEVRSVFPGVVAFSASFEDFGQTVVIHHPNRVYSLYAGLDSVEVRKGDVVSFSDVLGVARTSIYFEIRVDNRPQDPLAWLR